MRIQKYGGAAVALGANDVAHHAPPQRIESRRRLVEKNQFGLVNQRLRQSDALQHALGKILQAFVEVGRESHQLDQRGNALRELAGGNAAKTAVQVQKFCGRQPFVKPEIFRKEPDFSADFNVAGWRAQHQRLAARRFGEAQKHFDRCAFSRAVRAEEAEDFAAPHGQSQVAHRDLAAEHLAQILRPNREVIRLGQSQLLFTSANRPVYGLAGIAESRERIIDPILRPDQRIPRAAPPGHAEERAVRAVHLHFLVRAQRTWNR